MLHLPAGRELSQQGIPLPSAQWHVLDSAGIETPTGSVREDLQFLLTDWLKDHPDVQVVIYQGLRFDRDFFPDAWLERGNMDATHAVVPEITNPAHRTIVQQNTFGWLDLTPPRPYRARPQIGFAFDNTGVPNTRDALVAVAEDTSLFRPGTRVFVSGEAIPHQILPGACAEANLLAAYTNRAPWLATMDFYQRFDKDQSWSALPSQHLGFGVRNREYPLIVDPEDGSCQVDRNPPGVPLSDEQVRAAICSAHHRGFVIIHYGGRHDAYIRSLYATSPKSCSIPFRGGDNPPTESGPA